MPAKPSGMNILVNKLRTIMDKTKCYDIFQKTRVNEMKMYTQDRTIKDVISYSMELKSREKELRNIKLMTSLCPNLMISYNNLTGIKLTLKKINLIKQLFIYKVELGDEVFIPNMLNQKDLGQCFTFYNPILSIIQDQCSDHKKNFYFERNKLLLRMANEDMQLF